MKRKPLTTKQLAFYGLMIALALILSYLESLIPPFFAVPGMKLGLTNLVVLIMLYSKGARSAVFINFVRILLVSLLFGNGMSFAYSMAGGLLSALVMILLKRIGGFSIAAVSIAGGVAHNVGQIIAAILLLQTTSIAWYLLILWFTGTVSGAVIGILGGILCKKLQSARLFAE
ncbi:MAG: Gx transporter family protein [Clostridia bacterium]|nr:Gx transporter family protein [Clostridia bacterium]